MITPDKPPSRWVFLVALLVILAGAVAYGKYIAPDPSQEHQGP